MVQEAQYKSCMTALTKTASVSTDTLSCNVLPCTTVVMLNSTLPWIGQVLLPGLCAAKTHPHPPACRRRAQEIEPGYCEPTYWIGMTTFNMGDPLTGLSTMKASLSCKYTASEALQALNKVYLMMMEAGKNADVGPMLVRGGGRMWPCCVMVMENHWQKPGICACVQEWKACRTVLSMHVYAYRA